MIILVICFLYFTLLEGHYGQTVGKMAVKIKVVKEADGSSIDYGEAAVRTILRVIDGLFINLVGAILIRSPDEKQRLGDRVAHTVVVKARKGSVLFFQCAPVLGRKQVAGCHLFSAVPVA